MDKIKTVKIKNEDGTVSEESYSISVDAINVDMSNGKELQETIGTIDIDTDGNIAEQLENLNDNVDDLNIDIKKKAYFFDTIVDMKNANLKVGDYVCTLGYYEVNDGGAAEYKIVDSTKNYKEILNNNLFAELIINNNTVNILQIGAKGDSTTNNSVLLQNLIDTLPQNSIIYIPKGSFYCSTPLNLKSGLLFQGSAVHLYNTISNVSNIIFETNGFIGNKSIRLKNLNITGVSKQGIGFDTCACEVEYCNISNFNKAFYNIHTGVLNNNHIFQNETGIDGAIDSRIINNFIYANKDNGIYLWAGQNDNIIVENKIEWNEKNGIQLYQAFNNIINNNIIDRSSFYGIDIRNCGNTTIIGNVLRRNYASGNGSINDVYSQIRIESCHNININSNVTRIGNSKDDGTGINIPSTALYMYSNNNLNLLGNDFSGGVNKTVVGMDTSDNIFRLDKDKQLVELLSKTYGSVDVTASTSKTISIPMSPIINNYSLPSFKRILVKWRNGDMSNGNIMPMYISLFKTWNTNYSVKIVGDTIDGITITGTYNEANQIITLTISATKSCQVQIIGYEM